ncbi:MAG: recombinase family protein [Planctomycetes bacterium]|nr:recombinase family protein [Planctomycetota bacterium]
MEFKSVHAQRDSIEAYVKSQRAEGWALVPGSYDDAGFSGGDTNRPAFKRLMADVDAGNVDVVVVHRIDRLSRSLSDFVAITAKFEKHGVAFVSVTEAFSTSTSAGRMMLNMLATFAQFERETIGERTRDKMAATRKRGMWAGGQVPLGYDIVAKKLVVNPVEAEQVRATFRLYLEKGSLHSTVDELNARGWRTKSWVGKRGQHVASYLYSVESLRQLLDRVVYIGREVGEGDLPREARGDRRPGAVGCGAGAEATPEAQGQRREQVRRAAQGRAPVRRLRLDDEPLGVEQRDAPTPVLRVQPLAALRADPVPVRARADRPDRTVRRGQGACHRGRPGVATRYRSRCP